MDDIKVEVQENTARVIHISNAWLCGNTTYSGQTRRGMLLNMLQSATTKQIPLEFLEFFRETFDGLRVEGQDVVINAAFLDLLRRLVPVLTAPVMVVLDLIDIIKGVTQIDEAVTYE